MDPTISGAIINSGANVASATGSFISEALFGKRNEQWAREDATTAYNRQRTLLAEQRAYESPAAQMQRYIDAGLNPNLIYGQQQGSIAPPSVPEANTASMNAPTIPQNMLGSIMEAQLMKAQIERLNTQNENDTRMTSGQLERWSQLNKVSVVDAKRAEADIDLTLAKRDEVLQGLENMKLQWEQLSEKVQQEKFQTAFIAATQDLRIAGANAEQDAIAKTAVALAMAKILNIKADTAEKWSQVALNKQLGHQAQMNVVLGSAQLTLAQRQADLIVSQIGTERANIERIMTSIASDRNYMQTFYGSSEDGWFMKGVHTFTGSVDATFRCLGQLIHGTSVVHQ